MVKEFEKGKLYKGDCLEVMKDIADKSVDMILCDLPYGTTQNKWDAVIPFESLWVQYERIIKENGAIVLLAQTPFDKVLGASNLKMLRYEWIWEKTQATGHLNAKKMPMKSHENILVFYKGLPTYNPQKTTGHKPMNSGVRRSSHKNENYNKINKIDLPFGGDTDRYPRTVLKFKSDKQKSYLHPTQKPVSLFEYMISTYSNKGDLVLDNCSGSGTTGIAAINTNRKFILIEQDENYFDLSSKRIEEHIESQNLF
jgi:DNA modification methylase